MTPSEPPFQGGSNDVWVSGSPPWTKGRYSPPIADGAVPSELPERHFVAWRPMHVAPCMHASQHLLLHGHPAATSIAAAVAESWYVIAKFSTVCLAAAK